MAKILMGDNAPPNRPYSPKTCETIKVTNKKLYIDFILKLILRSIFISIALRIYVVSSEHFGNNHHIAYQIAFREHRLLINIRVSI